MLGLGLGVNRLAPAAAAFSPASLSGLMAWYDFQDEPTVTLINTNEIDGVADKSGNGYDLSYADPSGTGEREVYGEYVNNKKYGAALTSASEIRSYGHYENTSFPSIGTGSSEVFYVGASGISDNANNNIPHFSVGPVDAVVSGFSKTIQMDLGDAGASARFEQGSLTIHRVTGFRPDCYNFSFPENGTFGDLQVTMNGQILTPIAIDGTPVPGETYLPIAIYSSNQVDIAGKIRIFGGRNTGPSNAPASDIPAYFGELIVYNRKLSDSERASVSAYLMAKWGIA